MTVDEAREKELAARVDFLFRGHAFGIERSGSEGQDGVSTYGDFAIFDNAAVGIHGDDCGVGDEEIDGDGLLLRLSARGSDQNESGQYTRNFEKQTHRIPLVTNSNHRKVLGRGL